MFMHNPDVEVAHAAFNDLGRTNKLEILDPPYFDEEGEFVEGTGRNATGRTDEKGAFVVRDVTPGAASLRFDHPSYMVSERTVEIMTGESEAWIGPTALARGAGISGVVVDEEGRPVAGVEIRAVPLVASCGWMETRPARRIVPLRCALAPRSRVRGWLRWRGVPRAPR